MTEEDKKEELEEQAEPVTPENPRGPEIRILAMDGGGLYGLTEALWLEQLLEQNPDFLAPEDGVEHYFAGTSAGAVNAMLLAKEEDPRKAIRDGVLVRFWNEEGLYTNRNPMENALSWLGLRPWLGTADSMEVLRRYFGDSTMGDLHHKAIVCTYNWYGANKIEFPDESEGVLGWPPWSGWFQSFQQIPTYTPTYTDTSVLSWRPKFFTNFEAELHDTDEDDDSHQPNVEVAYAGIAMPPVRSVRGGVGDGGIFNGNPSVDSIGVVMAQYHSKVKAHIHQQGDIDMKMYNNLLFSVIERMHMLSLGCGAIMPRYWLRNFSMGPLPWRFLPVNPSFGHFTPQDYMLNQNLQAAAVDAKRLLHQHYYRLDPGVMKWPPGPVLMYVRNRLTREVFIQQIERGVRAQNSLTAVKLAAAFSKNEWKWF